MDNLEKPPETHFSRPVIKNWRWNACSLLAALLGLSCLGYLVVAMMALSRWVRAPEPSPTMPTLTPTLVKPTRTATPTLTMTVTATLTPTVTEGPSPTPTLTTSPFPPGFTPTLTLLPLPQITVQFPIPTVVSRVWS